MDGELEAELETGTLPMVMVTAMAGALDSISEMDEVGFHDGFGNDSTHSSLSAQDDPDADLAHYSHSARDGDAMATHSAEIASPLSPATSSVGRKRRQDAVDLPAREELDKLQASESGVTGSSSITGPASHSLQATTVDACYGPMRASIRDMQEVLSGGPIVDHNGLVALCQSLSATCDALVVAMSVKPKYGLVAYARIMDLLKSNLTDRAACSELAVSAGPYEWLKELEHSMEEWQDLSQEDQEAAIEEANDDMEGHAYSIGFCLEEFDELVHEEKQNEGSQLQCALHQRLHASFASR